MCYDSPLPPVRGAICIAGDLVRCNDDSPDQVLRCEAAAKLRDMQAEIDRLRKERNARQLSLEVAQTEIVNQRAELNLFKQAFPGAHRTSTGSLLILSEAAEAAGGNDDE